jgi:hypothetical protein
MSAQEMEDEGHFQEMTVGVLDVRQEACLFPIEHGLDVRAAEEDDAVGPVEELFEFRGAGVGPKGRLRGYGSRDRMKSDPVQVVLADKVF